MNIIPSYAQSEKNSLNEKEIAKCKIVIIKWISKSNKEKIKMATLSEYKK